MIGKLKKIVQLVKNMGLRYIIFRSSFELKKRTGLLKRKFPTRPSFKDYYTLDSWRNDIKPFFFESREIIDFNVPLSAEVEQAYKKITNHQYTYFSNLEFDLGANYDWLTNPDTGYKYDVDLHWLAINDYDPKVGDIKFVWEPSRFSHLYTIIRYDKHAKVDCAKQVFEEIEKWLNTNPINQGPNYKCSQEISLRVMNWTFALYYYKNSPFLTEALFAKIQHAIYWQIDHVYQNINFSRIAVRNNHAITETLMLYLAGILYSKFPGAKKWKLKGKAWFEQEIAYQIYEDGSFLQFSMNYHRVVVQLLTWALQLAKKNRETFAPVVYDRAKKSLYFLMQHMNEATGWLPNYGNNDGALFFKFSDAHYRDYRPQLEALSNALDITWPYESFEDARWYGMEAATLGVEVIKDGFCGFEKGGFYLYRGQDSLTFIRCGNHKDRPAQADNLHVDIWHGDKNLLHDGGTYKYNAKPEDLKYFMGTASHNTVMLGEYDQMEKGARFIWYHWTQCKGFKTSESEEHFHLEGEISSFTYLDPSISHKRIIKIHKKKLIWEIEDKIENKPAELLLNQIWHTTYPELLQFTSEVPAIYRDGFYSNFYGAKEVCTELVFSTPNDTIKTIIEIKS